MNGKVPGARLWGRDWRSELRAQNQWKASLGRRIWRRSTKIQQSLLSPVLTYQIPVVVALVVAVHHHRRQFPAAPSFRLNPKNPLHRRDQRRERGDSLQFGEIERDRYFGTASIRKFLRYIIVVWTHQFYFVIF